MPLLFVGLRRGLLVGFVIFAITAIVLTIFLNVGNFIFSTLGFADAVAFGVFAGLVLGVGFVWLGLVLAAIGVLIRPNEMWVRFGAWVAAPIIVVAAGFGLASYNAFQAEQARPTETGGVSVCPSLGCRVPGMWTRRPMPSYAGSIRMEALASRRISIVGELDYTNSPADLGCGRRKSRS